MLLRRLLLILPLLLTGCFSRVANVNITNDTGAEIKNVEVEYVGGSYGISHLPGGMTHFGHIKPNSDSVVAITYVDGSNQQHRLRGPLVKKDSSGTVNIHIAPDGLHF